ncbi:hypothetical protein SAMN05421819_3019 [Bryocella elongata]|uniref:Uncharacterized protein n=1 Tax=Bryocella elongata TaxID=863522 RepID=A0A1H6AB08_9BACT|nr:hypothetical protein [Bryocella elongata]SEG45490.1 hypothetical protein SAMN05421819_3019 [Bryocella elongata]
MRSSSSRFFVLATTLSLFTSLVTGCGIGTGTSAGMATPAARRSGVGGKLHGGPNPIQNASVNLWETWTTGISGAATGRSAAASSTYGSTAYQLATTTTDSTGRWNIANFNCDPGEYVYVTATGGKTASNSANPNEVLIAPLGACAALPTSTATQVDISELTTLAMAYTLGNFIGDVGASPAIGEQEIDIGAPAKNNVATGSCSGTGSSMTCVANGLDEAFADAISLVNATTYNGAKPTGNANTVPTDANGNMPNATGSIPAALLNTLANTLQSCVNTSGGIAGDTSGCGKLFTATTLGSNIPTDTLEAAINIAKAPASNVHTLYTIASTVGAFTPTLTVEPSDYTLAVTYKGSDATHPYSFGMVIGLALTPSGTVIMDGFATGLTVNLIGVNPDGSQWGSGTVNGIGGVHLVVDNAGHVYYPNGSSIQRIDASSFSVLSNITTSASVQGFAVDRFNNLYTSIITAGAPLYSVSATGTSVAAVGTTTTSSVPIGTGTAAGYSLFFDSSEGLWTSIYNPSTAIATQNFTSGAGCTLPVFCSTSTSSSPTIQTVFNGVVTTADGKAWATTSGAVYEMTSNNVYVTNFPYAPGLLSGPSIDGAGTLMIPDGGHSALVTFNTSTGTFTSLTPCSLRTAGSGSQNPTCSNVFANEYMTAVSASGAVWSVDDFQQTLVKVFGIGTPAWPYLGYNHPGEMPQ